MDELDERIAAVLSRKGKATASEIAGITDKRGAVCRMGQLFFYASNLPAERPDGSCTFRTGPYRLTNRSIRAGQPLYLTGKSCTILTGE